MPKYPDYDVTELQTRGGTIIGSLAEAIEHAEDYLYAAVVFECAKTWEQKPVRLWLDRNWYEVRKVETDDTQRTDVEAALKPFAALGLVEWVEIATVIGKPEAMKLLEFVKSIHPETGELRGQSDG